MKVRVRRLVPDGSLFNGMSSPAPLYTRQSAAVRQIQLAEKQQEHQCTHDSKSLDNELAQETKDFVSDQGTARLVIIGRNGTGKSTMINLVLLLSQVRCCSYRFEKHVTNDSYSSV